MKVFKELVPSLIKAELLRNSSFEKLVKNVEVNAPVIVSLTSFGDRINKVDIAIKSMMQQTYLPEKIILNLHQSYQSKIPKRLKDLVSDLFIINFVEEDSPHIKLIPTLQNYPDRIIVTVDDDVIYPPNLIENLFQQHLAFPQEIIANHVRVIDFLDNGLKPYKAWTFDGESENPHRYLALGFGGVLYPVNAFNKEVFNKTMYLKLAPKADDLWFKAMSYINHTDVMPLKNKVKNLYPIVGTQRTSLKTENVGQDRNTLQWQALVEHYNINLKV
ncbi:MAG: hypothetical protein ACR2MS_05195 [Weeksellaceae bacterium]